MPTPSLIQLFVTPLELAGMSEYMISGSVGAIEFGEPRFTLDVDLVFLLGPEHLPRLAQIFPEPDYYLPPLDVLIIETQRIERGHFNILHLPTGLKADCYTSRSHPGLPWALKNRHRVTIEGQAVWISPPEYIILHKLAFYRESGSDKHRRDIQGMLRCSSDVMNHGWLQTMVEKLNLELEWQQCR